jgi:putative copper resistance protein D
MTDLLEFISGLLDGMALMALAVAIGGAAYSLLVLRVLGETNPVQEKVSAYTLRASLWGAMAFGLCRLAQLILKPWALADATGVWAMDLFLKTQVFQSTATSVVLIFGLALALPWVRHHPHNLTHWSWVLILLSAFMINEAWLSHGASRLEGGGTLMFVTMLHLLGASVWAGGVFHLLLSWRLIKGNSEEASWWPSLVSRFSPIGMTSVGFILIPGLYLGWNYVGHWSGLIGTGYGNMLVAKVALFLFILVLAAFNFFAGRSWKLTGNRSSLFSSVPSYIEVEIVLAGTVLFTAAALTSFPPAVDVSQDTATPAEMWMMFSPKLPHLSGPELVMIDAPELTDLRTGKVGQKADWSWDRFNHNISGMVVVILAILAFIDCMRWAPWARHWPILFVGFSILIVVFANPDHWPLGNISFTDSAKDTEVVQHWLAGCVVFGLGWFEWFARQGRLKRPILRFLFPSLCILGGLILLTHSHNQNDLRIDFQTQSTHVAMGLIGVFVGCARWLELRLDSPYDRVAGLLAVSAIMLVGFILLFYVNPELSSL